jgi:GntR family transcriptional regulator, transcriptional repressor for pyruvate dehydrogenase complex
VQQDGALRKIAKITLVEQTVDRVQSYVSSRQLQPGDTLPSEMRLAETLGVSRPVVREALRTLVGRGMLTIANGRNAIISPVTATALVHFFERATQLNAVTVRELLEVRRGIEIQSIALAAQRRTDEHIANMNLLLTRMSDARYDLQLYSELDAQLHLQIAAASQNQMIYYFVESLGDALRQVSLAGLQHRRNRAELDEVHDSHCQLVRTVIDQHRTLAESTMALHVESAMVALRRTGENMLMTGTSVDTMTSL